MAELATIARPYAQALFQVSAGRSSQDTAQWLSQLAVVAADPSLQQVAMNPRLSHEQLFSLITSLLPRELPEEGCNFLRVILQNERVAALPEIARQFSILSTEAGGASDAVIYTAYPLEGEALASLVLKLEHRFGKKLDVRVVQDGSLIGGVRVVVGDEVLDASVKARVEQMRQALTA